MLYSTSIFVDLKEISNICVFDCIKKLHKYIIYNQTKLICIVLID